MSSIPNITPNQKLELIQMIRQKNQSDRNECRERERFLYGYSRQPETEKELYGAEIAAVAEKPVDKEPVREASLLFGFRLRFFLAIAAMALYIYMDKTGNNILGKSMEELGAYLTDNIEIRNLFDL